MNKVMTQEEKFLLLQDLCARLPYYGLMVQYKGEDFNIIDIGFGRVTLVKPFMSTTSGSPLIEEVKPYLRPMSSMTEEEKKELQKITNNKFYAHYNYISNSKPSTDGEWHTPHNNFVTSVECNKTISWLDEKHFDHRTDEEGKTLIEKVLALEAPEGMYNKKSNYETRR